MARIKEYFIAGLIAIIPIVATWALLLLSLKVANSLLGIPISSVFGIKNKFLESIINFLSGIFITIVIIMIAGYITTKIGRKSIGRFLNNLINKVPIINSFYTSIKQLVDIIILNKAIEGFKRVVLVEYPRKGLYAIGFVTGRLKLDIGKGLISIYIPKPLSLASGFLILVEEDEVIQLEIPVNEGFKMVVSAGLMK